MLDIKKTYPFTTVLLFNLISRHVQIQPISWQGNHFDPSRQIHNFWSTVKFETCAIWYLGENIGFGILGFVKIDLLELDPLN